MRALRNARQLGLVQLGEHTGLSPALLSKIERGQLFPHCRHCFELRSCSASAWSIFSRAMRRGRWLRSCVKPIASVCLTGPVSAFLLTASSCSTTRSASASSTAITSKLKRKTGHLIHTKHTGAELVYVISGELVINIAGEDHPLRKGDSIYFDCSHLHNYRRRGHARCAAIVVVTP